VQSFAAELGSAFGAAGGALGRAVELGSGDSAGLDGSEAGGGFACTYAIIIFIG
jgi:hypothetical protein